MTFTYVCCICLLHCWEKKTNNACIFLNLRESDASDGPEQLRYETKDRD